MTDERRTDERVYLAVEAKLEGQSGRYMARVADISMGGCFVDTPANVNMGDTITIELKLPEGPWLPLSGQVVFSQPGIGFSMCFNFLTSDQQRKLRKVISA
jgi:Tfp pilus assembly protein PilZ